MKEIKKAIIYGRVSPTDDPNEDKIETQLFKVRNYCQRMGWEVVKEFVEPGHVSGTIPILERRDTTNRIRLLFSFMQAVEEMKMLSGFNKLFILSIRLGISSI